MTSIKPIPYNIRGKMLRYLETLALVDISHMPERTKELFNTACEHIKNGDTHTVEVNMAMRIARKLRKEQQQKENENENE